jgi:hypothetical protein
MMTMMHRRIVLYGATILSAALFMHVPSVNVARAQQESRKPEVKLSEAKLMVAQHVKEISLAAKESNGRELSAEEQSEMVNFILSQMAAQGTYAFVDP